MRGQYLTILILCLVTVSCEKKKVATNKISGSYTCTIHYLHTWAASQSSQGTIMDTMYLSLFSVEESAATLAKIQFPGYNGVLIKDKLDFVRSDSTILYFSAPHGSDNQRSELIFNEGNNDFQYTRYVRDNPSGGGNKIVYTIKNK